MDEKTTDALRHVLEDMAQALQLATKNGEGLVSFLEDMLSSLESWAAQYSVSLDIKPAIALHSEYQHAPRLSSQINRTRTRFTEEVERAVSSHQYVNNKQAYEKQNFADKEQEAEHLRKGFDGPLSDILLNAKSSAGVFCFEAECVRARMQAEAERRHDTHVDTCGNMSEGQAQMQLAVAHAETQKDMHLCEKRAKRPRSDAAVERVKEERCLHESMASLGSIRALYSDPHVDFDSAGTESTPTLVQSSLQAHPVSIHAYTPAPERFTANVAMALHAQSEPCASEQKGKDSGLDWPQKGSSM